MSMPTCCNSITHDEHAPNCITVKYKESQRAINMLNKNILVAHKELQSLRAALTEAEKALEVCECGCKEMICEKYCAKLKAIQTLRAIAEGKK